MVFNTVAVGASVTPAVVSTFFSHYLNRKPLAKKPTAHITYDEAFHLIRKFLVFASHNTVEDFQRFTGQWVPHPTWVLVNAVPIPQEFLVKSAEAINEQLGNNDIAKIGGKTWWQWRRPGGDLKAEWIEMKNDAAERTRAGAKGGKRVMLYVHGGAYFFGSTDEHRYQMQRHARKLKARVFAPRYRLAPQFPFPCGLHDCLAAYLYLLTIQDPTTIVLAGDSAGGGMVISMLVILRDRGLPLPAGAILISPWVDLTHSFPSVAGDNPLDYIPPYGFLQKPSPAWPPPNSDDMLEIQKGLVKKLTNEENLSKAKERDAIRGFSVDNNPPSNTKNETAAEGSNLQDDNPQRANTVPGPGRNLSIMLDGKLVEIKDQIQMYTTNQLISHPLVSPVLQPSLGGLPPLLIMTGGGEMLRDEQIYLAHKAANPEKYPPGDAFLDELPVDGKREEITKWKPTDVQLQVWDDLCHVAPTLSFTRPAKYMYRSIAQFGAWALARAQKTEIEIMDDDDISVISKSESDDDDEVDGEKMTPTRGRTNEEIGKAGDPLPPFRHHMIRQRVDRHGIIRPLEPAEELPGCKMTSADVGVVKQGPVRKWMQAKQQWDTKYASAKRKVQRRRAKEMAEGGFHEFPGEVPPPSALAGRIRGGDFEKEEKPKRSYGLGMWSMWGSKHDEQTIKNEEEADKEPETALATPFDGAGSRPLLDVEANEGDNRPRIGSRSRSRRTMVKDQHQTDGSADVENAPPLPASHSTVPLIITPMGHSSDIDTSKDRPKIDGIAMPFKLKRSGTEGGLPASSASIATIHSAQIPPMEDMRTTGAMTSGLNGSAGKGHERHISNNASPASTSIVNGSSEAAGETETSQMVLQNEQIKKEFESERPGLDSFSTAAEDLPRV